MSATNQNLGDFARNPDGRTYDGRKVVQWLFEATTGKPMSSEEAEKLVMESYNAARNRRREK